MHSQNQHKQNIDERGEALQRKPEYLYRITHEKDGRWLVCAYLEQQEAPHTTRGPSARFTDEALPDWIRKDVALLSMCEPMGELKGIGHRVGEAFWLVTERSKYQVILSSQVRRAMAEDAGQYVRANIPQFIGEIK